MKQSYIRLVVQAVVQMAAMIFFMRVVRWDIFISAGLSALIALAVGFGVHWMQKQKAARED
jgi:hypothetical protein